MPAGKVVSIEDAQAQLEDLIDEVLAGGDVVIAGGPCPPVRLIAVEPRNTGGQETTGDNLSRKSSGPAGN